MIRIDPPPLATWILEHLTPADRDDALAGDLLEQFRAGRSTSWYWRQTVGACVAGWAANLRARAPLLVFAVLWSMLAPAWAVIVDHIEVSAAAGPVWRMDYPLSETSRVGGWLLLNVAFLWAGILLFVVSHAGYSRSFQRKQLLKSLALSAGLFLPIYFATFVVANLFAWPGPMVHRHSMSALAGLSSLAFWADALRVPYFITLVCALWGAVVRTRRSLQMATASVSPHSTEGENSWTTAVVAPGIAQRFFAFFVAVGLMNALLVTFLLCDIPQGHMSTLGSLLWRAGFYVAAATLAGLAGAWLYWNSPVSPFRDGAPVRFGLFALICASAWVWMPAMVLFYDQLSGAAALVAGIAAMCVSPALKGLLPSVVAASGGSPDLRPHGELFAESLYRPPAEIGGYVTALSLYLAGWALAQRSNLIAAGLVGLAASVAAWKMTVQHSDRPAPAEMMRRAKIRLALVAAPAFLLTVWALLDGVAHRGHAGAVEAGTMSSPKKGNAAVGKSAAATLSGYESVVLWPFPPKKEIVAPLPADPNLLAPGSHSPLVIPFNGAYWYLQPPIKEPGKRAHHAFGTPVRLNIRSNNDLSMTMQAQQLLENPVLLSRCRAIEVDIENADDHPGSIALAMLLEDSRSKANSAVYLGQQALPSTASDGFRTTTTPVHDSVRFEVPSTSKIRSFDRISIMILPDWERTLTGPKIAIDQFQLFPR